MAADRSYAFVFMRTDAHTSRLRRVVLTLSWTSFALLAACGGGGIDTNVRMAASDRPDVSPARTAGALVIPSERAFNYPRFSSGQEGAAARGASAAEGAAGAVCSAESKGEGNAWGAFQLGYAFDHEATQPSRCTVHVRLTAKEEARSVAGDKSVGLKGPAGSINLSFFMKDSTGLTIKEESLVSSTLARGPREATTNHDFVFEAELAPERGYYIVIGGRADASTTAGSEAATRLTVSDISMTVRWITSQKGAAAAAAQGGA